MPISQTAEVRSAGSRRGRIAARERRVGGSGMCAAKAGLRRFLASPGYTGGTSSSLALTRGIV